MGRQRDRNRMSAVMAGARERGMIPNTEPLTDAHLDMLEEDFRGGRGCFSGDGLALVAEVRRLRSVSELTAASLVKAADAREVLSELVNRLADRRRFPNDYAALVALEEARKDAEFLLAGEEKGTDG